MQQIQTTVRDVPLQLNQMMMDLQTGNINVGVMDRDAEKMRSEVRWVGIRLSMAMIAGSLGVAGALLVAPFSQLSFQGMPVTAVSGAVFISISFLMWLGLLMHTLFAARIHPREWFRRWVAIIRFFLPGKNSR